MLRESGIYSPGMCGNNVVEWLPHSRFKWLSDFHGSHSSAARKGERVGESRRIQKRAPSTKIFPTCTQHFYLTSAFIGDT